MHFFILQPEDMLKLKITFKPINYTGYAYKKKCINPFDTCPSMSF